MSGARRKTSIWVSDTIKALADARLPAAGGSFSGLISTVADRYQAMVAAAAPDLSAAEWELVYAALRDAVGYDARQGPAAQLPTRLWILVQDHGAQAADPAALEALVRRLRALSYCEQVAVVDAAERYWAGR